MSFSNGYSYRRTVTIDHSKCGSSDSSNFPALVSGTYSYLATAANGGKVTNANGFDIIFTSDAAGLSNLNWEVETYDATTGAVNYWVQIPALSSSVDTIVYVFYGNSNVSSDQSNAMGTWDGTFISVYHLGNGVTLSAADSTGNNNGTLTNSPTATVGVIDGAAAFVSASTQYIVLGSNSSLSPTAMSYIVWAKATSFPGADNSVVCKDSSTSNYFEISVNNSGGVGWFAGGTIGGANADPGIATLSTGTWYHLALTYATNNMQAYVNAVLDASNTSTNGPLSQVTGGGVSTVIANDPTVSRPWNGVIDELQISNVQRSSDWILTQYNNQSSPATFYTLGSEIMGPTVVTLETCITGGSDNITTTPLMLKGEPGAVTGWSFFNNSLTNAFVKLYDTSFSPTVGTDIPTLRIGVASSKENNATINGATFNNGIWIVATQNVADSDSTSPGNVISGQVYFN